MKTKILLALLLFVSWVGVTSYFLYDMAWGNYGQFDQQGLWLSSTNSPLLTPEDLGLKTADGLQVVQVYSEHCACNRFTAAHMAAFSGSDELTAELHTATIAQLTMAGFEVPAVPMALVFEQGKLIYAGPYASGPLCSVKNSLLADILNGQTILPGLWLNGETKACRCLVSTTL